jgi:ligand-binding sensor domain-containing protein
MRIRYLEAGKKRYRRRQGAFCVDWCAIECQALKLVSLMLFLILSVIAVEAEKLPLKSYTTADGLAHNTIMRIRRDSHGFLWFCTLRGLSRFDGYSFTNYGAEQGLLGQVQDLLETREGDYWIATLRGLYRFNPRPSNQDSRHLSGNNPKSAQFPMFALFRLGSDGSTEGINALQQDERGTIWVATNAGLYRLMPSHSTWTPQIVDVAAPATTTNRVRILDLFEDHDGAMWVIFPANGALRLLPSGRIDKYLTLGEGATHAPHEVDISRVFEDHNHQIWLATDHGVSALGRAPYPAVLKAIRTYTTRDGLSDDNVQAVFETTDGSLWAGTGGGLSEFCAGEDCGGKSFRSYTTASLGHFGVWTLADDRDGNLWMGNEVGALRLARDGFT